jgi:hypothetical protein
MASQRTLPYFPTLVKGYDTRSRGIYGRAALPDRKHHGPGKPAQPGDTQRPKSAPLPSAGCRLIPFCEALAASPAAGPGPLNGPIADAVDQPHVAIAYDDTITFQCPPALGHGRAPRSGAR